MKTLIIAGPTASGKSAFALLIAKALNGVIINADSMQWYEDLPILTAQPTADEKKMVPHKLYGCLERHESGSAALWQQAALTHIHACHAQGQLPIIVGGSGLYLRTLTHGLSPIIPIPDAIRQSVRALADRLSLTEFRDYVFAQDTNLAHHMPPVDRQRLTRALEVKLATGQSIRTLQGRGKSPLNHPIIYAILAPERATLCNQINQRILHMIDCGTLNEIQSFWQKNPPTDCMLRKVIGLSPLTAYNHGDITLTEAITRAQIETCQYAKRQTTWFKGQSPAEALINPSRDTLIQILSTL